MYQLCLPARLDTLPHARAQADLVDTDQHRLARLPACRAVLDEVIGQLVQSVIGGDHFVVLAKQLLQEGDLVWTQISPFNLRAMRSLRLSRAMTFTPVFRPSFTVD